MKSDCDSEMIICQEIKNFKSNPGEASHHPEVVYLPQTETHQRPIYFYNGAEHTVRDRATCVFSLPGFVENGEGRGGAPSRHK